MGTLLQDLRYGWRMLVKHLGFTAAVMVTLALGIGANTTIFSWISSTLLDPIPGVARTSDLVSIMRGESSEHPTPPFSYLDYVDLRVRNRSFAGILAYHDDYVSLTGTPKPERIYGAFVSADYFEVLGLTPMLGRGFLPAEEEKPGGTPAVIISYGLWQSHFGADKSIIGRTIQINKHLCTIVGVVPPDFQGCKTGLRSDVWVPLVYGGDQFTQRGNFWLNVLGRLKPGIDVHQAESELNVLMQQVVRQYPDSHRGPNEITLDPLWRSPFGANVYLYKTLPMLLALASVLLLLACANVANLLLVRSVARRREIATRLSIGASRWRLIRQLLIETLMLALGGGALAILLTTWTAGTFSAFFPPTNLPLTLNGRADFPVILASLVISMLAAVIFGILPAFRSSNVAPVTVLKDEAGSISGGLHKSRISSMLVVAQIALSLLLLVCAGLFARSMQNTQRLNPGFDPNHILLASYELGPAGYSEVQGIAFHRQLLAKLEGTLGIESVTLADFSPLSFSLHSGGAHPEGYVPQPHESMEISRAIVGPNYLRTMRIPNIAGRDFTPQDTEKSQRVAIINQAFADRYWPSQDAMGKRVKVWGQWFTVTGIAQNGKYRRLIYAPEPVIFLPLFQAYHNLVTIHARVTGDPRAFAPAVERIVHELNPELPIFGVTTLKSNMQLGSIVERVAGTFAGSFGLLALVLAAVGIYGVVDYSTRQRTHEIGIRMALGAQKGDVFRLVLSQGLRLAVMGLIVGLMVSLVLTRFLRSMLFGVTELDALTFAGVSLLLCLVTLIACYIPARWASRVDPMEALRYE